MAKKLNVGLIGCGFMGKAHSNAYLKMNKFFDVGHEVVMKCVCDNNADRVKAFGDNWGWQSTETDWRKMIARDDIDLVDICTPNNTHHDIVLAAAAAGKMVALEKPLSMNAEEGVPMVEAVEKTGKPNMVWFNYRRVPAAALTKQILAEDRIGRVFHYRAKYLQDYTISPDVPQGGDALWRLDAAVAGSGVTGDLLAHSIDTAMWLNGAITRVTAKTKTFVTERKHALTGQVQPVTIDDACMFLA
ncbi:MAG: Gfo/Idh/MocA family oxidoreductase, partial [Phycisphaerae bacterium]|nr:Gfo/Idh/MocA family oxidoreductase [Phycisphaerae bacterium]